MTFYHFVSKYEYSKTKVSPNYYFSPFLKFNLKTFMVMQFFGFVQYKNKIKFRELCFVVVLTNIFV